MTPSLEERVRGLVERAARPLGVERYGFCRLGDLPELLPCRGKRLLEGLPPDSSLVVVLLPYYAGAFPERNLARYALCDDYHSIAGDILQEIIRPLEDDADREMLRAAISLLGERERQIILMRFGFVDGTEYTQKEVADMMGISQSYISRLEKRIIARLHREMLRQMQV